MITKTILNVILDININLKCLYYQGSKLMSDYKQIWKEPWEVKIVFEEFVKTGYTVGCV